MKQTFAQNAYYALSNCFYDIPFDCHCQTDIEMRLQRSLLNSSAFQLNTLDLFRTLKAFYLLPLIKVRPKELREPSLILYFEYKPLQSLYLKIQNKYFIIQLVDRDSVKYFIVKINSLSLKF